MTPNSQSAPASHGIRAELDRVKDERDAAEAEIRRLRSIRHDLFTTGTDAEVERHDADRARHDRTVELSTARITVLSADLDAARHAERQAERQAVYDAAVDAAAEAERVLRKVYAPSAAAIRDALARVAELRGVVRDANAYRPDGALCIPDVESFRRTPSIPPQRVDEVELHHFDQEGNRVNPLYHSNPDGTLHNGITVREVKKSTILPHVFSYQAPDLNNVVVLPALLPGEAAYWPT